MDGVLNNRSSMVLASIFGVFPEKNIAMMTVDKTCVVLFEQVVRATNSKIVISSTWRKKTAEESIEVKNALTWATGNDWLWNQVIGVTPRHRDSFRGREIQEWLDNHPDVTEFVIIDDDSFDVVHKDRFVHCDHESGFTWSQAEKALQLFGIDWQQLKKGMHNE